MSFSTVVLPTLAGGGSALAVTSGVGAMIIRALKRVAGDIVRGELSPIDEKVNALTVKLAAETGGNSNGIRQAVNEMGKTVTEMRVDVAHLKGVTEGQARTTP